MKITSYFILAALLVFIGEKEATAQPVALEYSYPKATVWTMKKDKNGIPYTPLVPYAKELFKRAGIEFSAKAYPAKRLFKNMASGKLNFSMLVKAPILSECCLFSKKPIVSFPIKAFYRYGNPPIKSKEDLLGKNLAMIHGYTYGKLRKFVENNEIKSRIRSATDHRDLLMLLINRDVKEYAIDYAPVAEEVIRENPVLPNPRIQSDTIFMIHTYLTLAKSYPNAEEIMEKLERTAATLDITPYIEDLKNLKSH